MMTFSEVETAVQRLEIVVNELKTALAQVVSEMEALKSALPQANNVPVETVEPLLDAKDASPVKSKATK